MEWIWRQKGPSQSNNKAQEAKDGSERDFDGVRKRLGDFMSIGNGETGS